ncbi:MAG: TIR domain-containing protein [Chloroflexi bacterium]|nr:TIR domain-containing protein [Chloroflexota bacterium]
MQPETRLLPQSERVVLDMTFGLHGRRQRKPLGIAREFGVTREGICAIRRNGLRHLERICQELTTGRPLPESMLADFWDYEILISVMQEVRSQPRRPNIDLPITEVKERLRTRVQEMTEAGTEHLWRLRRMNPTICRDYEYDVALSFAGPERHLAKYVATVLRQLEFRVFYDDFDARKLWGKELTIQFDEIYRKKSRYCVIFVSPSYAERMWTNYERRSALARVLQEKNNEYILPIEVEPAELPGIPPNISYLSMKKFTIEHITEMLKEKLEEAWLAERLTDPTDQK